MKKNKMLASSIAWALLVTESPMPAAAAGSLQGGSPIEAGRGQPIAVSPALGQFFTAMSRQLGTLLRPGLAAGKMTSAELLNITRNAASPGASIADKLAAISVAETVLVYDQGQYEANVASMERLYAENGMPTDGDSDFGRFQRVVKETRSSVWAEKYHATGQALAIAISDLKTSLAEAIKVSVPDAHNLLARLSVSELLGQLGTFLAGNDILPSAGVLADAGTKEPLVRLRPTAEPGKEATVTLRNGAVVKEWDVIEAMKFLRHFAQRDAITLGDVVARAKDRNHKFFSEREEANLRKVHFLNPDGSIPDPIRNIILSAVLDDKLDRDDVLVNPVKSINYAEPGQGVQTSLGAGTGTKKTVTLRNGVTVEERYIAEVMKFLGHFYQFDAVTLGDVLERAKNREHQFFYGTEMELRLKQSGLIGPDGNIPEPIRNIILSAVVLDGGELSVVDPVRAAQTTQ